MRRLMAALLSVALLALVVCTSAAQPVQTPDAGTGSAAPDPSSPPGETGVKSRRAPSTALQRAQLQVAQTPAADGGVPPAPSEPAPAVATPPGSSPPPAAAGPSVLPDPASLPPPPAADPRATSVQQGVTTNTAVKDTPVDAGTYGVRLRDLEQRINELKEQIFRSKARLSLLAETVLQGVVAGSQARIIHENKMGSSYKLVKVVYALDGAPIFNKADEEGSLGDRNEFDIYNGSIVPGEHTLTVKLEYRGHGFGIFSYLKGYRFKVSSSHTFSAPEGKAATLRVVGFEQGGPAAPLEDRPAIRYIETVAATVEPQAALTGAGGT